MGDVMAQYCRTLNALDAVIRGDRGDRWGAPSPCEGWRAIDGLSHLIWDQRLVWAWAAGAEPDPQPSPPGTLAGSDPLAAWSAAGDATLAALTPAALDRTVVTRYFGEKRVGNLVESLIIFDLLAHTWDIARAMGQDIRLDPELVRAYAAQAQDMEATMRQSGAFGPARPARRRCAGPLHGVPRTRCLEPVCNRRKVRYEPPDQRVMGFGR